MWGGGGGKPLELILLYTNLSLFQKKFFPPTDMDATNEFSLKSTLFIKSYLVL